MTPKQVSQGVKSQLNLSNMSQETFSISLILFCSVGGRRHYKM